MGFEERAGAPVVVRGGFDDLGPAQVRFLQEAARLGPVRVRLLSDRALRARGREPRFPEAERRYLLEALRWVETVALVDDDLEERPGPAGPNEPPGPARARRDRTGAESSRGLPAEDPWAAHRPSSAPDRVAPRPRVLVTGCYDWLHSGHVRFFEEAASFGELHVTVGNDASVASFKGPGHPMFPARVRRYMVASVRHVASAYVATASGWLDAAPEIERIGPRLWVVNADGDRPEKRAYCARHGIEYRVLDRLPRPGLPARSSTALRGY